MVPESTYSSLDISSGVPVAFNEEYPFPCVLSHNDIHQNNILMCLTNNIDIILIDNEYAGWNPMAMDLAVYINETMIDNSYPMKNGIKEYMANRMSSDEQVTLVNNYLREFYKGYLPEATRASIGLSADEFVAKFSNKLMAQTHACILLNNFFWGVWALSLLSHD